MSDLHNLQFTVAHALGLPVFTSRLLATDLNTGSSTSNRYEVFTGRIIILLVAPIVFKITPLHGPHGEHRLLLLRIRVYSFVSQ
jgi:hypothetical protein